MADTSRDFPQESVDEYKKRINYYERVEAWRNDPNAMYPPFTEEEIERMGLRRFVEDDNIWDRLTREA